MALSIAAMLPMLALTLTTAFAKPPPSPPPTVAFAPMFHSDMVLQQKPAKAAVYGTVPVPGMYVIVQVDGGYAPGSHYTVTAKTTNMTWKALLHPSAAGGLWTISVQAGGMEVVLERVTFGDVWYCSGQSNMALPVIHTLSHQASFDAIQKGKYSNIRIHGMNGNMNPFLNWTNMSTVSKNNASLMTFSSTCWYFGMSLTDELGDAAPPIGLIHTAWGGSTIEQWLDNTTLATCKNVSRGPSDMEWHTSRVLPYVDMTIKGWAWYQGENDMHNVFGNSALGYGYGCNMPNLVKSWRSLWSATAGTTDPMAPFGLVTIANSGSEGGRSMGAMHWAQTANYGVAPNPALPNTFLAQAFDLDDPFGNITCYHAQCCPNNKTNPKCHSCFGKGRYCDLIAQANFYMGPIHPRSKAPVGQRLAKTAAVIAYGKAGAYTGPTISGCSVSGGKITITFNAKLLGNDQVIVQDYSKTNKTAVEVLTNSSLWCVQTEGRGDQCRDDGTGHNLSYSGGFDSNAWQEVDIAHASATSITVDLAKSQGVAYAIRYAWEGECCSQDATMNGDPCPVASCPIMSKLANFPANPFLAKIKNGKCECLKPQVCDGDDSDVTLVI